MAKRLTEKDLEQIQSKIKISNNSQSKEKIEINKISLHKNNEIIEKKKKNSQAKVYDIIKSNKEATFEVSVSDTHFSVIFHGAKLLSINQIFAILQYRKYEMFSYKKSWHDIIKNILLETHLKLKSENKKLPYFDDSVELTIFRQAPRLVDEDALTTMFKFIIDAFKREDSNPYGILAEDNPKIVHKIESYSEKGSHCVGIKIKLIDGNKKKNYTLEQILIK